MEVWLKHLTVVLFTVEVAALVVSGPGTVSVGKPEQVSVAFGSSVTLGCVFNAEKYERFRVSWHFNNRSSSLSEAQSISEKVVNKSLKTPNETTRENGSGTEATHLLSNVTDKNSGWYFCRVISEIPSHCVDESNGTQILVSSPVGDTWWIWVVLAVSTFIMIVLLITCASLRSRCISNTGDDPVYANTRPVANKQPSPRPGVQADTLKIVHSSQNLRTPNPGRRYDEGKRRQKL